MEHVRLHIKYIGFRSNELATAQAQKQLGIDNTRFFSKDDNNANYKDFIKRIETNKALKYPKAVKMQKLVFSLKEEDFKNYIRRSGGKDFTDLMKGTMEKFCKYKGQDMDWIAVTHLTDEDKMSKHPHCHVAIKGVSNQNTRIKFDKDDFKFLRQTFDTEFNKVCEYEKKWEVEHNITNVAKKLVKAIERDGDKSRQQGSNMERLRKRRAKKREIEMELDRSL